MRALALGALILTTGLGCASDLETFVALPALDEAFFRCRVQPILSKSCAFLGCHGDGRRFYRLYARNRLRLGKTEATRNAPLDEPERRFNFDASRAMVDRDRPAESLLLTKPLDDRTSPIGRFHRGQEIFDGDDVYTSADDPEWKVLERWVGGETDDPACIEPGSDL